MARKLEWKEFWFDSGKLEMESALQSSRSAVEGGRFCFDEPGNVLVTNFPMSVLRRLAYMAGVRLPKDYLHLSDDDETVLALFPEVREPDACSEHRAGCPSGAH